jgi:large conductance mechanosensitive channel
MIRVVNNLGKRMKKEEEEAPAEPTTKDCPFCFSSIAIKATRCPNCTSQLDIE